MEANIEDLKRLLVYAHLEPVYKGKAWVLVDGDPSGVQIIDRLRQTCADWPPVNFVSLAQPNFDLYYPAEFATEVSDVLALPNGQHKQDKKKALLNKVVDWIDEDDDRARTAFETSAANIIGFLLEVEAKLLGAS